MEWEYPSGGPFYFWNPFMYLKHDVNPQGMRPELVPAWFAVFVVMGPDATVTSLLDGEHSHTSLHYSGCAMDIRTRDLSEDEAKAAGKAIKDRLGKHYDVIVESTHIHIEYQPRKP